MGAKRRKPSLKQYLRWALLQEIAEQGVDKDVDIDIGASGRLFSQVERFTGCLYDNTTEGRWIKDKGDSGCNCRSKFAVSNSQCFGETVKWFTCIVSFIIKITPEVNILMLFSRLVMD